VSFSANAAEVSPARLQTTVTLIRVVMLLFQKRPVRTDSQAVFQKNLAAAAARR
jgi:hypothetical protein